MLKQTFIAVCTSYTLRKKGSPAIQKPFGVVERAHYLQPWVLQRFFRVARTFKGFSG
jgi:hypothetical protein